MTGVTIERGDGAITAFRPVRVRLEAQALDARPYRAPYGTRWRAADGRAWTPPILRLTYEATNPDGISRATGTSAAEFITALEEAALITTVAGVFIPAGIMEEQATPITNGYAITVKLATRRPRAADDSGVLRFMSGRIWELR